MSLETYFRRFEGVRLCHRVFCPVQAVENKLPKKRETNFSAERKMLFALPVHQEQMVAFGLAANVDILSHFDVAFRAQNDCPAISPGAQTSRSQPIHPKVRSGAVVRNKGRVPKIFQFQVLLVRVIGHPRRSDAGIGSPGKEKELVNLVAADIA